MKKMLVSVLAMSVVTGAFAASTLVSGENSGTSVAAYRAGSVRVNKTANNTATQKTVSNDTRIGSMKTISSNKLTGGTSNTGGSNTGSNTGTTGGSNSGALTNAAMQSIQSQLDGISSRLDTTTDTANNAASSIVAAQNAISGIQNDLAGITNRIGTLEGLDGVSGLTTDLTALQNRVNALSETITSIGNNYVTSQALAERIQGVRSEISALNTSMANSGSLTAADIASVQNAITGATNDIAAIQETLATKAGTADIAATYATKNDLANATADKMTAMEVSTAITAATNDMASKTWVDNQGYAKLTDNYNGSGRVEIRNGELLTFDAEGKVSGSGKVLETTLSTSSTKVPSSSAVKAKLDEKQDKLVVPVVSGNERLNYDVLNIVTTPDSENIHVSGIKIENTLSDGAAVVPTSHAVKKAIDSAVSDAQEENTNTWGQYQQQFEQEIATLQQDVADIQRDSSNTNSSNNGTFQQHADQLAELSNTVATLGTDVNSLSGTVSDQDERINNLNTNLTNETARLDTRVENLKGIYNTGMANLNANITANAEQFNAALAGKLNTVDFADQFNAVAADKNLVTIDELSYELDITKPDSLFVKSLLQSNLAKQVDANKNGVDANAKDLNEAKVTVKEALDKKESKEAVKEAIDSLTLQISDNKGSVAKLEEQVKNNKAEIDKTVANIQNEKADKNSLTELGKKVDDNALALKDKASVAELNKVSDDLGNLNTNLTTNYATKASLNDYATTASLSGYATTGSVNSALENYVLDSALNDKVSAFLLNEIANPDSQFTVAITGIANNVSSQVVIDKCPAAEGK